MRGRSLLLFVVALVGIGAWYALRPERTLLDRRVSEAPPPVDTDLARFTVVSIWCRRFGVNFMEAETVATM